MYGFYRYVPSCFLVLLIKKQWKGQCYKF
jgi:hypothetical protein